MEKKTCTKCKIEKLIDNNFHLVRNKRGIKVPDSICKICVAARRAEYYLRNKEIIKNKVRAYQDKPKAIAKRKKRVKKYYDKGYYLWPEKYQARAAISKALSRGKISKPNKCEDCSTSGRIEAHHDDYSKRLEVRWLCVACHKHCHRVNRVKFRELNQSHFANEKTTSDILGENM